MEFTAQLIANFLEGTIIGDKNATVHKVDKIEEGEKGSLSFLSNPKYEEFIYSSKASIIIVDNKFTPKHHIEATLIKVENPYACFAKLLDLYVSQKPQKQGVSPKASISDSAQVGENLYLGDFSVIDQSAKVGDNCKIYPQVYIGDGVKLGNNVTLFAGVKIYEGCIIGDNVIIHSGAIIGADGFGFAPQADGSYSKIPQIGNVVIKDNVEIGANTCIDRATMGSTVIEKGVKLDNLIQLAHNTTVGENSVMAAQVGVAGSTKVGSNVMMGGQVGIAGHITIADKTVIGSQSGVNNTIKKEGEMLLGYPAIDIKKFHRSAAIFKELPEIRTKLWELKKELETLKG